MTATRRLGPVLALLAAGALLLAGCATGAASDATDAPTPSDPSAEVWKIEAGWVDGGRQIALVTWGSSSCPPTASDVTRQADGTLAVTLDEGPADRVCTSDFAPRATGVGLPDGIDPAQSVDIVVTGAQGQRGETTLAGLAGASGDAAGTATDYLPSAGWVGDDLIAILTWGSSTCAPVVSDVAATDPANVSVTFTEGDETRPCTMDMAPRLALAEVSGLSISREAAHVTLTGGDAQFASPVTIPVIG